MTTTYAPFDVVEYLDNDAEYLTATLEDANPQEGTEDDSPAMSPCIQGCHGARFGE
jgi:hypothetical protein